MNIGNVHPKAKVLLFAGVALVAGGFLFYAASFLVKEKMAGEGVQPSGEQEGAVSQGQGEAFEITGKIVEINLVDHSFTVRDISGTGDFTVSVNNDTPMTKLQFPFDPANPPEEISFTPTKTSVTIDQLKAGDQIFVRSSENLFSKKEIRNIEFIQILP